jgi:hypothetical protein
MVSGLVLFMSCELGIGALLKRPTKLEYTHVAGGKGLIPALQ